LPARQQHQRTQQQPAAAAAEAAGHCLAGKPGRGLQAACACLAAQPAGAAAGHTRSTRPHIKAVPSAQVELNTEAH
jgi:hypothetical protein